MKLKKLSVQNFQSIVDANVEFVDGVYTIIGFNKDSGNGSNGSGKTSLVRAITTAILGLSYSGLNAKELKNFYHPDEPSKIEVELEVNNKPLIIKRVIGGQLKAFYGGEEIIGKASDIQSKIMDIIGLTPNQFLFLTHKTQEDAVKFLFLKDVKKKEFLSEFFSAKKINVCHEKAKEKLKNIEQALTTKKTESTIINSQLQILYSRIQEAKNKIENFNLLEIENIKNKIISLEKDKEELKKVLSNQELITSDEIELLIKEYKNKQNILLAKENEIKDEELLLQQKIDLIKNEIKLNELRVEEKVNKINQEINSLQKLIAKLDQEMQSKKTLKIQLESKIDAIAKNLDELYIHKEKHLHDVNCYTCNQPLPSHLKEKILEPILIKIQTQENQKLELSKELELVSNSLVINNDEQKEQIMQKIQELVQQKAEIVSNNTVVKMKSEIQEMEMQKLKLQQSISPLKFELDSMYKLINTKKQEKINLIKQQLASVDKELELSKKFLSAKQQEYNLIVENLKQIESEKNKLEENHQIIARNISELQEQEIIFNHVERLFHKNGLISFLFDDLLCSLTHKTNLYLREIPILSRLNIKFKSYQGEGTEHQDRVIGYDITNELGQFVSIDTLSGAEKQLLALMVDLALDDILSERLGVNIGYKIYDEQFSWVDAYYKEYILNFLKKRFVNGTLLIIDHGSELNSSTDLIITVVKENGQAYIKI